MKKVLLPALLALGMVSLACAVAYAGNSVLLTGKGQITFPLSPPNQAAGQPGALDNTIIGATTPAAGTFSSIAAAAGYTPSAALDLATKGYVDTNALRSVTTSRRIAAGVASITGTGTAATGLTTIVACFLTLNVGTAPGLGTSVVTYTTTGATLNLFAWKPTDATNPTLIAATAAASIAWTCIGT